ncbi:MAG: PEP-utilizing enzyme [Thermodesulfovibrionales bacterium]
MTEPVDICSLDYLIGTLATAYRGLITSLVAKDFCMTEEDGTVTLRGTILSMPDGAYQASLLEEGREVSRIGIRDGFFEFKADRELVKRAQNLQIDIIQNGRHIGTFLLKREKADAFFVSAMELSQELQGIPFKRLISPLAGKPGFLKNAEDLIAKIASTKKDWRQFSEAINSFSKDLFWVDRDSYYEWYDLFCIYSLKACKRVNAAFSDKLVSNFLSLIELPLEKESDQKRLRGLVDIWLQKIQGSSVNLARHVRQVGRALSGMYEKFPDMDIRALLDPLIVSLKERAMKTPAIKGALLDALGDVLTNDDQMLLDKFSEEKRRELLLTIEAAEAMAERAEYAQVLGKVGEIGASLMDDTEMIDAFFGVIERNMTETSGKSLFEALYEMVSTFNRLSPDAVKRAMLNLVRLIRRMIDLGMVKACETMLTHIEGEAFVPKEDIVLNPEVAEAVLHACHSPLLEHYKGFLRQIVIPAPRVTGFSDETWAEVVNPLHLSRLSKFLSIIRLDSDRFRDILIHVICNLSITGVFIPDERLFQREVSSYLNADTLRKNFLFHYLLLQRLPVYYHEVGATGRIRDDTTAIDSWGNDPVLYFLRKQVHVNASNYNIHLLEQIIKAWVYKDYDFLKEVVPEDVLNRADTELLTRYSSAARPAFESLGILDGGKLRLEKILAVSEDDLGHRLEEAHASKEIRSKVLLICRIYQEIVNKYSHAGDPAETKDLHTTFPQSIRRVQGLKEIILSPEKTQPEESLYFKRHIAFGIPSVMGSYHERKFDAIGEILRNEDQIRVMVEKIISEIDERKKDFSEDDARQWIHYLEALNELFAVHALGNFQVDELITILRTNRCRTSQIIDMLRMWQRELTWMVESLTRTFYRPLMEILKILPEGELPEHLRRLYSEEGDFANKATDVILRDMMNSIAGFVELDRILIALIDALSFRVASGSDEEFNRTAGPDAAEEYFVLDELSDIDAMRSAPAIGSKAKNLAYLRNKELLVPSGVVFSARHTRDCLKFMESLGFTSTLRRAVEKIEARTGMAFGGAKRPLFLSVRSGSYISMPGILSTILYCGMNRETLKAFIEATDNPWLGWDSYRRFIEHYSTAVYGLDARVFEDLIETHMKGWGVAKRADLDRDQMEGIVGSYIEELARRNLEMPEDVYEQLTGAVKSIYSSWYAEKAMQFREAMNVSEHWGTAVTLMQMIYGNDRGAGTSVFFTRNPFSLERGIYGDTKETATGGDLVYGKYTNRPLAREQALADQKSLEEIDPQLFFLHERLGERIEEVMGGLPQEVEATYTRRPDGERRIYVLQTRRMEFHRTLRRRFDEICKMGSSVIGRGVGVNGGALSGIATFSASQEHLEKVRHEFKLPIILLRRMASTDDVSLMPKIDGIVTATGGVASHAAVLAQKFGLTAVVGCSDMDIKNGERDEPYARIGTHEVTDGTAISIDGSTGLVYSGLCLLTTEEERS